MGDADSINELLIAGILVIIITVLFYWKIIEFSKREKIQNGEETKETQQEPTIPGDENPSSDESGSGSSDFEHEFTCEICNKTFSGLQPSRQVYKKDIQKEQVRKLEEGDSAGRKKDDPKQTLFAICKTCKRDVRAASELIPRGSDREKRLAAYTLPKEIQDNGDRIILRKLRQKHKSKSRKVVPIVMGKTSECFSDPEASESSDENDGDIDELAKTHELVEKKCVRENMRKFECLDCKMVFNGVYPWFQHLDSEVHEETLKQKELFDKLRISGTSLSEETLKQKELFDKLRISGTSLSEETNRSRVQEGDVIDCRLCDVTLSGQKEARAHLKSKKHKSNLERKNSMTESRGEMKKKSEVKELAYSKPSVQSSSDVHGHKAHNQSIEAHDLETKGRKIDKQERKRGFSMSEELSFGHEGFKSISATTSSPAGEKDTYLLSSNATGGYSPARTTEHKHASADVELSNFKQLSEVSRNFSPADDAVFSSNDLSKYLKEDSTIRRIKEVEPLKLNSSVFERLELNSSEFELDLDYSVPIKAYRNIPTFLDIEKDYPEITKNQAKSEVEPRSFQQSYSYC